MKGNSCMPTIDHVCIIGDTSIRTAWAPMFFFLFYSSPTSTPAIQAAMRQNLFNKKGIECCLQIALYTHTHTRLMYIYIWNLRSSAHRFGCQARHDTELWPVVRIYQIKYSTDYGIFMGLGGISSCSRTILVSLWWFRAAVYREINGSFANRKSLWQILKCCWLNLWNCEWSRLHMETT